MSTSADVRLHKFLAEAGVCSRRAAEALITQGEVWVNGVQATIGQKVVPARDKITVSGKPVRSSQPRVTLAVHKPRGLVCSNEDPYNP
ncbi:MAG: S4 domain-containing protein, partial [Opitutales bacterium]